MKLAFFPHELAKLLLRKAYSFGARISDQTPRVSARPMCRNPASDNHLLKVLLLHEPTILNFLDPDNQLIGLNITDSDVGRSNNFMTDGCCNVPASLWLYSIAVQNNCQSDRLC